MKQTYYFCMVLIMLLIFSGVSFAQDSGMTNGNGVFRLDIGYERLDFDMDLESSSSVDDISGWNTMFEVPYERNAAVATASYGVCNYMDIQFSLGFLEDELLADSRTGAEADHTQKGDSNYFWKIGMKFNFIRFDSGLYIGGAASYSQWDSGDESYVSIPGFDPQSFETECVEYAGSVYVGMKWGDFSPWAGVEYTQVEIEQHLSNYSGSIPKAANKYEIEDNFGAVLGLTYMINEHFDVTARGRFINQTSLNVGVGYKF